MTGPDSISSTLRGKRSRQQTALQYGIRASQSIASAGTSGLLPSSRIATPTESAFPASANDWRAVSTEDLVDSVETTRKVISEAGRQLSLGVAIRGDTDAPTVPADEIDCEARIPHCKAVCCRLRFPLTVHEIESGPVKWDLGRPYFNRQAPNGYCHCFDDASHGCTVYNDRPTPCRVYSCAGDDRIWKDFEGMVINQEWIDAHLGAERSPIEIFMETAENA